MRFQRLLPAILLASALTGCAELYSHTEATMNTDVSPIADSGEAQLRCVSSTTGKCYFMLGNADEQVRVQISVAAGAESTILLPKEPTAFCQRPTDEKSIWAGCHAEGWVLGPRGLSNVHSTPATS